MLISQPVLARNTVAMHIIAAESFPHMHCPHVPHPGFLPQSRTAGRGFGRMDGLEVCYRHHVFERLIVHILSDSPLLRFIYGLVCMIQTWVKLCMGWTEDWVCAIVLPQHSQVPVSTTVVIEFTNTRKQIASQRKWVPVRCDNPPCV